MSIHHSIPLDYPKPIKKLSVGDKVFMLTILEIIPGSYPKGMKRVSGGHKHRRARAICDCGVERVLYCDSIRWHKTKSCGCLSKVIGKKHGMHKSSEYGSWDAIKRRCYNKNGKDYYRYGGRGITVCDRWINSFENFFEDMGFKPSPKHTLDRIDNNGNYEPGNCRWATAKEQAGNRPYKGKLNADIVEDIRKDLLLMSTSCVAKKYSLSWSYVSLIKRRKVWYNIDQDD